MDFSKIIPEDFCRHTTREITIFTNSIFGETYALTFKQLFGVPFTATLWVIRNNNFTTFYRSQKEHEFFNKELGEKAKDKLFTQEISEKLIELTDWFNHFVRNNDKNDLIRRYNDFVDNYRLFLAYHQAVYWASYYLHEKYPNLIEITTKLDLAYEYNQMVVPNVENYLRTFDLVNRTYKEGVNETKDKGLLFLEDGTLINLYGEELDLLERQIINKSSIKKDLREIRGTVAHHGKVKGKARVILDLNKLNEVEPDSILITTMTRPQFNHILNRCKGIVTNDGGMLCHASILAREFGIPCLVGTKIATEIFQDGDLVELNTEEEIVRKLE